MVESVEMALVRERPIGRMKTLFSKRAGMDFSNEWQGPIKMGIPYD